MKFRKYLRRGIIIILVIFAGIFWWRHYFVFGEGVKAGNLNFLVKKGYIFKTWEGRLIQSGFKTPIPGAMQSNEFEFSIKNDSIARMLERASGRFVELRYKEYIRPLPWRGMSNYIVIEILRIEESRDQNILPY
jgi:hypothetical protein